MTRKAWRPRTDFVLLSAALLQLAAEMVVGQDTAVILGGGRVGSWFTTGSVANVSSSAIRLQVTPFEGFCPAACIPPSSLLPANGSLSLDLVLSQTAAAGHFETFYLTPFASGAAPPVPAISARMVDESNPVRSVDIPVVLISRLEAANPSILNFGGVTLERGGPGQSNLVLGNIARQGMNAGEDLLVTLDLLGEGGLFVGTTSLTIPYRGTALIGDVVNYLGGGSMTLGQLRVTRIGGNALMWGILYTVDASGAVTSTAGVPLSP